MADMKKLIEAIDTMTTAEKKTTGPKFPGYWKGKDSAAKSRDKMVGSAEESIIKDLHSVAKKKVTEWSLAEDFKKFKEETPPYTGIDPIVRQRMGMPPASLDDVVDYTVNNPPYIRTGDGSPLTTQDGKPVLSGGDFDVLKNVSPTWAGEFERPQKGTSSASPAPAAAPVNRPTSNSPAAQAFPVPVRGQGDVAQNTVPNNTSNNVSPTTGVRSGPNVNIDQATRDAALRSVSGRASAPPTGSAPSAPATPAKVTPGSWQDIWKQNPDIKNPNLIRPGQEIKLPNGTSAIVDKGDTLSSIAQRYRQGGYNTGTEVSTTPVTQSSTPAPAAQASPRPTGSTRTDTPTFTDKMKRVLGGELPSRVFGQPKSQQNQPTTTTASSTSAPAQVKQVQSNPTVNLGFGDPGYTPFIGNKVEKRSDGKWYYSGIEKGIPVRPDVARHAETQLAQRKSVTRPSSTSSQPTAPKNETSSSAKSSNGLASYSTKNGRVYAADFNNPSGIGWDGKGKYTSYKTPEEGVNATRDLVSRYLTDQTPYIKGSPTPEQVVSTWVSGGRVPADKIQGGRYLQSVKDELAAAGVTLDSKGRIPYSQAARDAITRAIVRHETSPKHMEKFAPFLNQANNKQSRMSEADKKDEKIAGRYDPDDFDAMVKRLGQRAREQERKHGPVDIAALAKKLKDIEKREQTKEQEDPAINMQDPDVQRTSQTSPQQDPAAVKQQQLDQQVDVATAKGTMSGLKNVLGPKVDVTQAASAATKISDGKPLTGPEQQAISSITPLMAKAAETPQTAMALKTALSNAAMLAKQGK